MLRRALRSIGLIAVVMSISVGSVSAGGIRVVRIPPPPVPGLRNLPALRLPVPGDPPRRHVRLRRARYYRAHARVWVPGHWAPRAEVRR